MRDRVLFFGQTYGSYTAGFEASLAKNLQMRGVTTRHVVCGSRDFRVCDLYDAYREGVQREIACAGPCTKGTTEFLRRLEIPFQTIGNFVSPEIRNSVRWLLASGKDPRSIEFQGINLYEFTKATLGHYFNAWYSLDPDGKDRWHAMELIGNAVESLSAAAAAIERYNPEAVVVWNGNLLTSRAAIHVARAMGIDTYAFETGVFAAAVVGAKNKAVMPEDLSEAWNAWKHHPLTDEENAAMEKAILAFEHRLGVIVTEGSREKMTREELFRVLGVPKTERLAILFTTLPWETGVRGIPFEDQRDWILETAKYFAAHPEWTLVVRIHPIEALPGLGDREGMDKRLEGISFPPNVRVVRSTEKLDTYCLMDYSDLGLSWFSTTGIEMAVRGKPIVVCGNPNYRGMGFTYDPETPERYFQTLDRVLANPRLTPEWAELAKRYTHLYLCKQPAHLDDILSRGDGPDGKVLLYDNLEAIGPNGSPGLNRVAEFVLNKRPWIENPPTMNTPFSGSAMDVLQGQLAR